MQTAGAWKGHLWGRHVQYLFGEPHPAQQLHLDQNLAIGPAQALVLELSWNHESGQDIGEAKLGWNYYW